MPSSDAPTRPDRGFTLLEAVLALIIIASVMMALMQLRAQNVRQAAKIDVAQQNNQAMDALVEQAINNLLPQSTVTVDRTRRIWTGEHLGSPYRVEKRIVTRPNPAAEQNAVAPTIRLFEYTITWRDRTSTYYSPQ